MAEEVHLHFDIRLSKRMVARAMAAALLLCAAGELGSETVTLTTYYPAPSGVYAKMITTGDTYLARDGGTVEVGAGSTFHARGAVQVDGATALQGNLSVQGAASVQGGLSALAGINTGAAAIATSSLTVTGAGVAPGSTVLDVTGNVTVTGTLSTTSDVTVGGTLYAGCNTVAFGAGGLTSCPAGKIVVAVNYTGGAYILYGLEQSVTGISWMTIMTTGNMICCRIQ